MIRRLGAALFALLLTAQAFAQTASIEMPAPQTAPFAEYVTGWDESGFITSKQVDFSDLNFVGVFGAQTTSNTDATIGLGNVVLYLNDTTGFAVDYTVQARSQQDPTAYFYGIITALDTSSGAATIAVTIAPAFAEFQNWTVQVVAGPTFGLPASSTSGVIPNTISVPAQGDTVTTTTDIGKAYLPGASVYVQSIADYTQFFIATVFSYNSATGDIVLFVRQFGGTGSADVWTISMVDTAGADANLIGYSASNVTPAAGDNSFTTQSSKFIPVGGSTYIACLTTPSIALFGTVKVYTSTSLIVTAATNMVFNAGACSAWSIYLVSGPPPGIPFTQRNGLQVSLSSTTLTVTAGSIRDSTNTYDLVLPSTFTKDLSATWVKGTGNGGSIFSANLSGTAAAATNTLTGSSSTFLTDFSNASNVVFPDFTARGGSIVTSPTATALKIAGASQAVANVTTNTAGNIAPSMTVSATTYQRGGYYTGVVTGVIGNLVINYGVLLIREDATGAIDIGIYSLYPGSTPDLPSGWSVFGALADLQVTYVTGVFSTVYVTQWAGIALSQISPMTTEGDLIYQHSGAPARLAVGSSTQVLTSNGTDPAWAQVSGSQIVSSAALAGSPTTTTQSANDNSTKIATTAYFDKCHATVASGSFPSANFLAVAIPAGCSNIQISWSGAKFDTASRSMQIIVSTDNGSTYDTTASNYAGGIFSFDAGTVAVNSVATMTTASGLTTAQTESGTLVIQGYATAAFKPYSSSKNTTVPTTRGQQGFYAATAAITNVKLLLNGTGNFTAGTYVVSLDYLLLPLGLFGIGRRRKPVNDNGLAQKHAA